MNTAFFPILKCYNEMQSLQISEVENILGQEEQSPELTRTTILELDLVIRHSWQIHSNYSTTLMNSASKTAQPLVP